MKVCPRCSELYPDDVMHCPRDGSEIRAVLDPLIGKTVGGRYRLISRIGTGGMSSVYLARHVMIDRLMAIKTLRRDLAQDSVQRDRFLREARAVNRINHENIVEITDFGESDGLVYLVMEYVPGESLLKAMAQGPFPAARALDIAEQVGGALGRAHQMGVVHRDLKPENLLLVRRRTRSDFVKILDFGIAKIMDAPSLTGSQQIFGTPGYIAPEYIQSTDIDGRADLYSLGVILYELVTGALPFEYEYPGDLLVKHVTEPPIPPRERLSTIEPALEELLLRCLRKAPAERFRDAYHFLEELTRVRERIGVPSSWGAMNERPQPRAASSYPPVRSSEPAPEGAESGRATIVDPIRFAAAGNAADTEPSPPGALMSDESSRRVPTTLPGVAEPTSGAAPSTGRRRSVTREYGRAPIPQPPSLDSAVPEPLIDIEIDEGGAAEPSERAPASEPTPARAQTYGILGTKRWRQRFDALRAMLDEVEITTPAPPEIAHAMAFAERTLEELEEGIIGAERRQTAIEELNERARDFRSTLGKAIDELGRKLSHHRGEFERLAALRNDLRERREVARVRLRGGEPAEGEADALLWELAAVEHELRGEAAHCDEHEAQVSSLRLQLDEQNEEIEAQVGKLVQALDGEVIRLEGLAVALRAPLDRAEAFVRAHEARMRPGESTRSAGPTPS